jgi:hypothetical protein
MGVREAGVEAFAFGTPRDARVAIKPGGPAAGIGDGFGNGPQGSSRGAAQGLGMRPGRGTTLQVAVLALLAALGSGCLDDGLPPVTPAVPSPADESPGPPGPDTYWFAHVEGRLSRTELSGPEGMRSSVHCDYGNDHAVDRARRTLQFNEHSYPVDAAKVWAVVAYDIYDDWGNCHRTVAVTFNDHLGSFPLVGRAGDEVSIVVNQNDGDFHVWLPDAAQPDVLAPGMLRHVRYEGEMVEHDVRYRVEGDVTVTNLGSWPRSGLDGTLQ